MLFYPYPGWPYSSKAVIQYAYGESTDIEFWLTFPLQMNIKKIPTSGKFEFTVDGDTGTVVSLEWLDAYTLHIVGTSITRTGPVRMKYVHPPENLLTSYDKQWEPWGYLPCLNVTT